MENNIEKKLDILIEMFDRKITEVKESVKNLIDMEHRIITRIDKMEERLTSEINANKLETSANKDNFIRLENELKATQ